MEYFSYEEIRASTKDFSLERLIGKGSHGCVYKGVLKGGKKVAVKRPSEGLKLLGDDASSKLDNEIDILSSIRNPNLVNLLGISRGDKDYKLLVTEYMPNGSLHHLIHSSSSSSSRPLSWPRRMRMALQIARATLSLHEAEPSIVVHRDIKSANILFDCRWNARLADFSLAVRAGGMGSSIKIMPAGTLGYLDPGYTRPEKLGPKNDVFSFGVVLLELISSRRAMEMDREPSSIVAWAVPLIREGRLADVCNQRLVLDGKMERLVGRVLVVAERCVSRRQERRPTMTEVVTELEGVVECLWWPSWECLRNKASARARRYVRAWRRCKKKRVTTTTRIICRDHLIDSGDDDYDDDDYDGDGDDGNDDEDDEFLE